MWGYKGDDQYFLSHRLKNGWKVDKINFVNKDYLGAGASYLAQSFPGADWPYVKIHWWCEPTWNIGGYEFAVQIKGPKGVPY